MSKAEEYIKKNTRGKVNHITENFPWITIIEAREAVEIAREETLLEVAAWINDTFIFSKQAKEDFSQTFNIMKELL